MKVLHFFPTHNIRHRIGICRDRHLSMREIPDHVHERASSALAIFACFPYSRLQGRLCPLMVVRSCSEQREMIFFKLDLLLDSKEFSAFLRIGKHFEKMILPHVFDGKRVYKAMIVHLSRGRAASATF